MKRITVAVGFGLGCLLVLALDLTITHAESVKSGELQIRQNESAGTISVYRAGQTEAILTQNARKDFRPYIHPIVAPDGRGVLTEYSPGHHKHQTGLYWGFTRVNGRDYFHHPGDGYWRQVSAQVMETDLQNRDAVQWQTVYELLNENGDAVLIQTQTWTMREQDQTYVLDLVWKGQAQQDITIGEYDYGGLFLRMPWRPGINGKVVNSARHANSRAEGQRAIWLDVGMQVEGRDDLAHIAIFDHSENPGFPQPWRVDGQLGVGPVRARLGDWKIDKGESAVIKHRFMVYTGDLNDVTLTNQSSQYSGKGASVQWGLAQKEGRAAEFLTPEKAVASMTLQDGFQVNAYAAEPMITQPMAFCWDDRGRMWVAENRDYETRGRGFSNSGDSRILILEDTDRDGVADQRKVFLEGIPFPAGIAVGFGGLWLGAPPNLLFVPDRDGNDKADSNQIEVRLTGWGIRDRHETLNSFHWGPDGWLYGCQGFATPSRVGKPSGKGKIFRHRDPFPKDIAFEGEPVDINGGVWRYHPTQDRFEVVAHGFSNPWGIDYDAKGQLLITACVIPHLWHVVPGGIYHRQGGSHFNPHVYADIRTIADHRHRSAHGGARVYLSDAFPEKYHGQIFMANIHEHAVLTDVLKRKGSGYVGSHGDDFLLANNAQWIGFSVEIGPEGGVYVLDWHDADICGKDVLNKDTGRVFRITPKNSLAKDWEGRYDNLSELSDAKLVDLQLSDSAWHARRARVILQHRATDGRLASATHPQLRQILNTNTNGDHRLRALWSLHVTEGISDTALLELLWDQDEYLRAWSIQLLCEDQTPSESALQQFVAMAKTDPSAVVRLYLAAALQRIPHDARWSIARGLSLHHEDEDDHNIPKMIWFGIEPLVVERAELALELAAGSRIPMLTRHIARRLTDDDQLEPVVRAIRHYAGARYELLLGMRAGLEGRYDVKAPDNWASVYAELMKNNGDAARIGTQLAQQFGDRVAAEKMLAMLDDHQANIEDRRQALYDLAGRKRPEIQERLFKLLDDEGLRRDAIRAMASYDNVKLARAVLNRYPKLSDDDKLEAVHTLASRPRFGWELTKAIKQGDVPRRDVPAYVARLLHRVVGNGFVEVWGPLDEMSDDKKVAFAKYRTLLSDDALAGADTSRGRVTFERTCMVCHKMYGNGREVGPDLTGANRTNLEYILGNVLTPSAVIQDEYKMHVVLTHDGRVFSGTHAGENERQLLLRVANVDDPIIIAKSGIESRVVAPVSMMPDGLLTNLSDEEVLNLVAYLRNLKQVPLPESKE